jgi:hypothetical protein
MGFRSIAHECTSTTRLVIRPCTKCGNPPKTYISLSPKRYQIACLACGETGIRAGSRVVVTLHWNLEQKAKVAHG